MENSPALIKEIKDLQKKFTDLEERNDKCSEYQSILNLCNMEGGMSNLETEKPKTMVDIAEKTS